MASRVTPRGFTIYDELTDRYGHKVRVQESSLATEACAWVFCDRNDGDEPGFEPSPHLTVAQAIRVRDALSAFIAEHGEQP